MGPVVVHLLEQLRPLNEGADLIGDWLEVAERFDAERVRHGAAHVQRPDRPVVQHDGDAHLREQTVGGGPGPLAKSDMGANILHHQRLPFRHDKTRNSFLQRHDRPPDGVFLPFADRGMHDQMGIVLRQEENIHAIIRSKCTHFCGDDIEDAGELLGGIRLADDPVEHFYLPAFPPQLIRETFPFGDVAGQVEHRHRLSQGVAKKSGIQTDGHFAAVPSFPGHVKIAEELLLPESREPGNKPEHLTFEEPRVGKRLADHLAPRVAGEGRKFPVDLPHLSLEIADHQRIPHGVDDIPEGLLGFTQFAFQSFPARHIGHRPGNAPDRSIFTPQRRQPAPENQRLPCFRSGIPDFFRADGVAGKSPIQEIVKVGKFETESPLKRVLPHNLGARNPCDQLHRMVPLHQAEVPVEEEDAFGDALEHARSILRRLTVSFHQLRHITDAPHDRLQHPSGIAKIVKRVANTTVCRFPFRENPIGERVLPRSRDPARIFAPVVRMDDRAPQVRVSEEIVGPVAKRLLHLRTDKGDRPRRPGLIDHIRDGSHRCAVPDFRPPQEVEGERICQRISRMPGDRGKEDRIASRTSRLAHRAEEQHPVDGLPCNKRQKQHRPDAATLEKRPVREIRRIRFHFQELRLRRLHCQPGDSLLCGERGERGEDLFRKRLVPLKRQHAAPRFKPVASSLFQPEPPHGSPEACGHHFFRLQ